MAFRTEAPESPLARCQAASLLVYDELTAATDSRAYEDVLLDLFEPRIGRFKPSIITANLSLGKLEPALGSRLFDRLRRAASAVLEFGFESKRRTLNAEYLKRAGSRRRGNMARQLPASVARHSMPAASGSGSRPPPSAATGIRFQLIGIPVDAVLEACDCCGDTVGLSDATFTGRQVLCRKCNTPNPER